MIKRALILSGGGGRGAFQVGVWKYLLEQNWVPDLICGSSIGAINAAAIASGIPITQLIHLWTTQDRSRLFRLQPLKFLGAALFNKQVRPIQDTQRLRGVLSKYVDIEALKQSPAELVITAVNISTGQLHMFSKQELTIDHLMASGAMPIFFPWQVINNNPYWDGGVMANTPILPALKRGAKEIVVVLLSPVGHMPQPFPGTLRNSLELAFEHFLSGSYQTSLAFIDQTVDGALSPTMATDQRPRIRIVAPSHMLGFRSMLTFSSKQARRLINEGYRNAREQLAL